MYTLYLDREGASVRTFDEEHRMIADGHILFYDSFFISCIVSKYMYIPVLVRRTTCILGNRLNRKLATYMYVFRASLRAVAHPQTNSRK